MQKWILEKKPDHFHLKLNRPEKRNALDTELMEGVVSELKSLENEVKEEKFLLLTGEGKSFCAGADLNWMKAMVDYSLEENIQDSELLFDLFYTLKNFKLPVISHVQGHVFGGGLGLLAASDYVICEEKSLFCFSEVKLGLIPAVISNFILAKAAGLKAFMLSGEVFGADTAFQHALVQKLGTEKELDLLLGNFKASSQEALIACKALLLEEENVDFLKHKDLCIKVISKLRVSEEAQKRMKNFLSQRESK